MPAPKQVTWENDTFHSIKECAEHFNEVYSTMAGWVKRGYTCYDDVPRKGNPKPVVLPDGTRYASQREYADALGISPQAVSEKLARQADD